MNFYNEICKLTKNNDLIIFCDMDGVISSYDVGNPSNFDKKRPLTTNISIIEKVSTLQNVEIHILSVCRHDYQIKEKNNWLDVNAPFFPKNKRHILSKESHCGTKSASLKSNFLKNYKTSKTIIMLDDDNNVLKTIMKEVPNIVLFQDSSLVD